MPWPLAHDCQIAVIGAGSIGLAVAYYAVTSGRASRVVILDHRDPMSLTSAQTGENYRNWWPHPVMTAFTDTSISLMEEIASRTGNRIAMTRLGYALATRSTKHDGLIADLHRGYAGQGEARIRVHDGADRISYPAAPAGDWETAPNGVDVLLGPGLIRRAFPAFAPDIQAVLHIRRAGSISGQQLGQYMLETVREAGGQLKRGKVVGIDRSDAFRLSVETGEGIETIRAERLVNAAGPFVRDIAALLDEDLPATCTYQ
jgi:glycine/D-amino acid oxidase-like deaminating enzyme